VVSYTESSNHTLIFTMKNVTIVYAHPNPASFNNGILETVKETLTAKGINFRVRDLYALNFNPVLSGADFQAFQAGTVPADIAEEQSHIAWADHVVFIYPTWWIDRPAILKGYIDRVFSYGFAYAYGENGVKGLLTGKSATVFTTTGSPEALLGVLGQSLSHSMEFGTLAFSGFAPVKYHTLYGISGSSAEERAAHLETVKSFF
jgi:NAD(P)H dehydrogenase (quinone)